MDAPFEQSRVAGVEPANVPAPNSGLIGAL
jgi:hypothetical protein